MVGFSPDYPVYQNRNCLSKGSRLSITSKHERRDWIKREMFPLTFYKLFLQLFSLTAIWNLHLYFRMEKENYSKLYIVKMPNNFCGIGAMMLNHPKNVSSLLFPSWVKHPRLDPTQSKRAQRRRSPTRKSCQERGSNNSSELHF